MKGNKRTLSLSILSGKGGVGKTTLALNIACALHQMSQDTLLVDCDLGLANLDIMLGLSPDYNLQDVLTHGARFEDIVCRLEKRGLDLIPSASGVSDVLEFDEDQQVLVIEKMSDFLKNYNFLLMDLGAGVNRTVQTFAQMTHRRVVVITPEPTSLTDAYALIKVLYTKRNVRDFHILVNMVQSEHDGVAGYERIRAACEKFLDLPVHYLGYVRHDSAVPDSIRRQKPLLRHIENSPASRDVIDVAHRLIEMREGLRDTLLEKPALSFAGAGMVME